MEKSTNVITQYIYRKSKTSVNSNKKRMRTTTSKDKASSLSPTLTTKSSVKTVHFDVLITSTFLKSEDPISSWVLQYDPDAAVLAISNHIQNPLLWKWQWSLRILCIETTTSYRINLPHQPHKTIVTVDKNTRDLETEHLPSLRGKDLKLWYAVHQASPI